MEKVKNLGIPLRRNQMKAITGGLIYCGPGPDGHPCTNNCSPLNPTIKTGTVCINNLCTVVSCSPVN